MPDVNDVAQRLVDITPRGEVLNDHRVTQAILEASGNPLKKAGAYNNIGTDAESALSFIMDRISENPSKDEVLELARNSGWNKKGLELLDQSLNLPSRLDRGIAQRMLFKNGMGYDLAGEVMDKKGRILRAMRRSPVKKAGIAAALGSVAGKLMGAPFDFLMGTDAGAPGGLSGGELPPRELNPDDPMDRAFMNQQQRDRERELLGPPLRQYPNWFEE